jgi:hypothetical protein
VFEALGQDYAPQDVAAFDKEFGLKVRQAPEDIIVVGENDPRYAPCPAPIFLS